MFPSWIYRAFAALVCSTLVAALACAADPTAPKSLDDQLLEGLETDLLPSASKPTTPATKQPTQPRAPQSDNEGLDAKLLDQLGEGEDIELGPQPNPLTRIGRTMRQVETLIVKRDTSTRTQTMQKQIVSELDALLEQTKKQCQGGQCDSPASASKPSSAAGNKPSEGEPSNKPAKDSTERLAKPGKTDTEDAKDLDELVKQVWGHLPDKVRGQMQNVSVENFLPKYEKLIEDYYKRLAEEQLR